jgi:hypothetical protein
VGETFLLLSGWFYYSGAFMEVKVGFQVGIDFATNKLGFCYFGILWNQNTGL